jgi:ABC-type Fe3+-hydroxamate transport system substrate-binding protein
LIPQRIVSLVPSLTETLFDLGAGDSVVGITDYCIFPPDLDRPRVGGTKNPRVEEIRALRPDLVHMNLEENLKRHADQISEFARVFVTEPKSVNDVVELLRVLGEVHGRGERAAELIANLESARFTAEPFSFACPIWKHPWMWCGGDTYVSGLVESTGGRNILRDRTRYPTMPVEEIATLNPDIIFLPDEPYLFTDRDAEELRSSKRARIIGPFPGHLFTWHGTRTIQGLQFLRGAIGAGA